MRLFGRRIGWLGWAVAGVLAVSAGGAALAATGNAPTTATATTQAAKPGAAGVRAAAGWRRALVRRALHGEVTLQTKQGRNTVVLARGKVTALSDTSITITSVDNVATTFTINGDTRFGFLRQPDPRAELKQGDEAAVVGVRSGGANVARRVVSAKDLPNAGATP
jgi:Domain of unknown function (DUF5666)